MAIRIITVSEPAFVHAVAAVNKTIGRPKLHPDRSVYRKEWMRRRRVQDRVDAILLAQVD
jgi:hypothetical protein